MSDDKTKNREIKGLVNACKNFNLKYGVVITYDSAAEYTEDDIKIELIPFYKWCLSH